MSEYLTISELAQELGLSAERALALTRDIGLAGVLRLNNGDFLVPRSMLEELRKAA